jgi:lipopolysaccharide transport system ATP-binding protein
MASATATPAEREIADPAAAPRTHEEAPLLVVDGVGKSYPVVKSNLHRFAGWFGLHGGTREENWALRDVSFTLRPGESIGIIGQNGAGKSTLLKLITGTVRPTAGRISQRGRISAMLELGLGFNPEFTGRQNVYLAGGLMGFSTRELDAQIPGIADFAELGAFFDEPLRVYSSGMQARLAFAIATATRPDLLIVDEVLSVGDSYFQHKCFDRIRRYCEAGTSLLFVSHSMGSVRGLCDRVILLGPGKLIKDGDAEEVIDYYNALVALRENEQLSVEQRRSKGGWLTTRSGSGEIVVTNLRLVDAATRTPVQVASVGQALIVEADIEARQDLHEAVLGYLVRDRLGNTVWGSNTWHTRQPLAASPEGLRAGDRFRIELHFEARVGPGSYSLSYALHADQTHLSGNYEWVDNALVFDVVNLEHPQFIGSNWLPATFRIER